MEASVVICTHDRPELFEAAVRSCLRDATRRGMTFEIVVADSSVAGHAGAIVAGLVAGGAAIRVVAVAPPNIARARNAGLRAAIAPLVGFLDDALEVDPGWLDALVDTLTASDADAAVGPMRPHFPSGSPPDWDPAAAHFTRALGRPTGSLIAASKLRAAGSLWRRDTCFTDAEPFDPGFGAFGAEDFDLCLRLQRRGRRFVWCNEAAVREAVALPRMRLGYQLLRTYRGAQVAAAAAIRTAPFRLPAILGIGLVQTVAGGVATLALELARTLFGQTLQVPATRMAFAASAGWGKLTWWRLPAGARRGRVTPGHGRECQHGREA